MDHAFALSKARSARFAAKFDAALAASLGLYPKMQHGPCLAFRRPTCRMVLRTAWCMFVACKRAEVLAQGGQDQAEVYHTSAKSKETSLALLLCCFVRAALPVID